MRPPFAAALVALALAPLSGCFGLFDDEEEVAVSCPEGDPRQVTLNVTGLDGTFSDAALRYHASCAGAPLESGAPRLVPSGEYAEIFVRTTEQAARVAVDLDLAEDGELALKFEPLGTSASWNGESVSVSRVDVRGDPHAFDPVRAAAVSPVGEEWTKSIHVPVVSEWNDGLLVRYGVRGPDGATDFALPEGSRFEVRVRGPDGAVVARASEGEVGEEELRVDQVPAGSWQVDLETWSASAARGGELYVEVVLTYGDASAV